jgi:hypothetical protein
MAQTSRSQDGLGYASEPPTLTLALYLVKIRIQELGIHLPIKDNSQDRSHPDGHTAIGAQDHPISTTTTTLVLIGSLLVDIKGGVQGP